MNVKDFKQISQFIGKFVNQSNTRHLSWIQQFGNRLQTEITEQLGAQVPALLASAITQYQAAAAHEDDCYLIISKSDLTPQIAEIDAERDTKYVGMKSMADALSRIGTAEQQQAATQLLDLCAHYKVDISERYDDETTKMSQLLQELQTETWTARIESLGLTDTVTDLVSLNQQMKHLIELRNNDLAQVTPQAMLQARAASDEAYALVVTIINALAVADWADGSSHYDQAIARINQDQDYYVKNVFAQGKGGSSSGSGDSSSGSGSGDSGSGDSGSGDSGSGDSGSGSGDSGSGDSGSGSGDSGSGDSGDSGSGSGDSGSGDSGSGGDNGGDDGGDGFDKD